MEYSLTNTANGKLPCTASLNPYSNGILPDEVYFLKNFSGICLNPYSNGILPDKKFKL